MAAWEGLGEAAEFVEQRGDVGTGIGHESDIHAKKRARHVQQVNIIREEPKAITHAVDAPRPIRRSLAPRFDLG